MLNDVDALESEQRFKGKAEGYTSTLEKKISPNVPPKPKVQPHSASAQQGGLHTPVACPSKPSCGKSVVEKHHKAIQHEMVSIGLCHVLVFLLALSSGNNTIC